MNPFPQKNIGLETLANSSHVIRSVFMTNHVAWQPDYYSFLKLLKVAGLLC